MAQVGERVSPDLSVLGKYELLQELAVGGMARLYIARAKGLADFSKPVVLKRILPQYAADPAFVEMFLDEARLAATLNHSNVVQVYDIGQLEGEFFFTMEYVHGESLSRVMQQLTDDGRKLPLEHAVAIGIGVAAGLGYAHTKVDDEGRPINIVHRDVAPSNILISYNGGIKLVDFGIAKANTRHHSTEVGTLKGRVAYMSPEQSIGAELDARSDIFSIGVVLYEIVTGSRMYGKANQLAILHQLLNFEIEAPSVRNPEVPPELERIIMKSLQPTADNRYQSAADLQYDLETFAHQSGLFLSSVRMSKFMRALFGDRPEPWKEETLITRIQQTTGKAQLLDALEADQPGSGPRAITGTDAVPAPARGSRRGLIYTMTAALVIGAVALVISTSQLAGDSTPAADETTEAPKPEAEQQARKADEAQGDTSGTETADTAAPTPPAEGDAEALGATPETKDQVASPDQPADQPAGTEPATEKQIANTGRRPRGPAKTGKAGKTGTRPRGTGKTGKTGTRPRGTGKTGKTGKTGGSTSGGTTEPPKNKYDGIDFPAE